MKAVIELTEEQLQCLLPIYREAYVTRSNHANRKITIQLDIDKLSVELDDKSDDACAHVLQKNPSTSTVD